MRAVVLRGGLRHVDRIFAAGGWSSGGSIDCTAATHKGMTIQFGGSPRADPPFPPRPPYTGVGGLPQGPRVC